MSGTYLSLFSGIGGLDLAVEQLGYTCVGQVEWDDHATRVLERWWPDVPRWTDITDFHPAGYAESAHPDLICGGFPCQPASTAGRRKGTADDRWLWPQFARVIGELGPRYVLVENVPGLTTVNGGRAFSEVLGTLADLGYDATWTSLRASDVGAPHRRQRLFLLAHAQRESVRVADSGADPDTAGPGTSQAQQRQRVRTDDGDVGDDARDTHDGGHTPVLRQEDLTRTEAEGQAGAEPGSAGGRVAADTRSRSLTRIGPAGDGLPEPAQHGAFPWGAYGTAVSKWERVMGPAPHPVDDKGRLHPPFVEWMMGFPVGWTDGSTRTQALKQLGNAVVPQQGAAALTILKELV